MNSEKFNINEILELEKENQRNLDAAREAKVLAEKQAKELEIKANESYSSWHNLKNELKQIEKNIAIYEAGEVDSINQNIDQLIENKTSQEAALFETDADYTALQFNVNKLSEFFENGDATRPKEGTLSSTIELYNSVLEEFNEITNKRNEIIETIRQVENEKDLTDKQLNEYRQLLESQKKLSEEIQTLEENPELVKLTVEQAKNEQARRDLVKEALVKKMPSGSVPERIEFIGQIVDQFMIEEEEARGISKIDDRQTKSIRQRELVDGLINGFNITNRDQLMNAGADTNAAKLLQSMVGGLGKMDTEATAHLLVKTELGGGAVTVTPQRYNEVMGQAAQRYLETFNLLLASTEVFAKNGLTDVITPGFGIIEARRLRLDLKNSSLLNIDFNGGPILPAGATEKQKAKLIKDFQVNTEEAQKLAQELTEKTEQAKKEKIEATQKEIDRLTSLLKKVEKASQELDELGNLDENEKKAEQMENQLVRIEKSLIENQDKIDNIGPMSPLYRRKLNQERDDLLESQRIYRKNLDMSKAEVAKINELQDIYIENGDGDQIRQSITKLQGELDGF